MPAARRRARPVPPEVGGLDALLGDRQPAPVPVPPQPEPGARDSSAEEVQPRRRGDLAADRAVKFFAYLSAEDDDTLRRLAEAWQCSRSEVLRVLLRRARKLL